MEGGGWRLAGTPGKSNRKSVHVRDRILHAIASGK